jgi:hypothetical protein
MFLLVSLFIHGTQIARQDFANNNSTIHDGLACSSNILLDEILPAYHHIAVNEQLPRILGLFRKEIANSRTTSVLAALDETTVWQYVYAPIGSNGFLLGGTVIGYKNFIIYTKSFGLFVQVMNQLCTYTVVSWNEYG